MQIKIMRVAISQYINSNVMDKLTCARVYVSVFILLPTEYHLQGLRLGY